MSGFDAQTISLDKDLLIESDLWQALPDLEALIERGLCCRSEPCHGRRGDSLPARMRIVAGLYR